MNLSNALCSTTYELAGKIDANRFAAQQCCCETQSALIFVIIMSDISFLLI